jgi:Tol biopolymer transport system component
VELFQVPLEGPAKQLTHAGGDALHYHSEPSPDGKWLAYGSKRGGVRQLYVRNLATGEERAITPKKPGYAAMWAHWQPSK